MDNRKLIGWMVSLGLFAALVLTVVWAARSGPTAAVSAGGMSSEGFGSYDEMMEAHHGSGAGTSAGGMSSEGFSSYDEMMEAHHGSGASAGAEGGCGGVAGGSAKASFAGETSSYGITYDDAGYQKLLAAAKSISLSDAQMRAGVIGIDILMPCCGVQFLQAKDNCECGHHVALFGLAKLLTSQGYDRATVQSEVDRWKQVFYPEGTGSGTGGC